MGYDKSLLARTLALVGRRIDARLRRSVKLHHNKPSVAHLHSGAITAVQRFRFDLGLYLHIHSLLMDGVYDCVHDPDCNGAPEFLPAPEWTLADLEHIVGRIDRDIAKLLEDDFDDTEHDGLAACAKLDHLRVAPDDDGPKAPSRISWARLLTRVFSIDIEKCPKCDGKMKVYQAVLDPGRIKPMLAAKLAHDRHPSAGSCPSLTRSPPHTSKLRRPVIDEPPTLARPPPHEFDALGQRILAIYAI